MNRWTKTAALGVLGLIMGSIVGVVSFTSAERATTLGAHTATISPDFSGHILIASGPLLPEVRLPTHAPFSIGGEIVLRDSPATNMEEILLRDAAIASQPQGEIARIKAVIGDIALDAALRGIAAALLTMVLSFVLWRAIGQRRRAEIANFRLRRRRQWVVAGTLTAVVVASAIVLWPHTIEQRVVSWVPIRDEFHRLPDIPALAEVQISQGAATSGSKAIVDGAVATYEESVQFYGDLAELAAGIIVRKPEAGETTAIVVTDRHDNVGMDPVARAVADAADASFLIDLGDDTSSGATWEDFSIRSLREAFQDFPVVAVAGNHDRPRTIEQMVEEGFTVLDGEPVEFEGIWFLGQSDPRFSGLTGGYTGEDEENLRVVREQDELLAEVACDGEQRVSVVAVHSAASAKSLTARGCADLVISGHLHRQVGPEIVQGDLGVTTSLTMGSSGGAFYAFSLGSKLRRNAQVTLLTFREGRAVGLQMVTFKPGGFIEVGTYLPVGPDITGLGAPRTVPIE